MMKTKEYRAHLAEVFARALDEKKLEWKKEWKAMQVPANGSTGYRYRGINRFYLALTAVDRGYQDHRWCTFHQIEEKGWRLVDAKGKGVKVEYWFPYDTKERKAISWEKLHLMNGMEGVDGKRYILRAVYKTVFNASLIEGIPKLPAPKQNKISQDALIGKLSANMGVKIRNDGGDRAFYRPADDMVHLPVPECFETEYAYGATALHELAHSTGAEHRLNRDLSGGFGSQAYAYEELIAEISSCFMSVNLQAEQSGRHIENHKAYVQSWVRTIREKPETLAHAIQQAERVASYMEYKAELISDKEYKQMVSSSAEVEQGKIASVEILDEKCNAETEKKRENDREGVKEMTNSGDFQENVQHAAETSGEILPAEENGRAIEEVLRKIREDQGVSKKSREELDLIVQRIKENLEEIREDTQILRVFAEKYGIPIPNVVNGIQSEKEEYYVIEDQKMGGTLSDAEGKEIRIKDQKKAERLAAALNEEEQENREKFAPKIPEEPVKQIQEKHREKVEVPKL